MTGAGGLLQESITRMAGLSWLPAAIMLSGVALAMLLDVLARPRAGGFSAGAAAVIASALSFVASLTTPLAEAVPGVYGGGGLAGSAGVVYAVAALAIASGLTSLDTDIRTGAAALVGLSAVACQALIGAVDVVVMAIALETVAIASYGLVSARGTRHSGEVAARYFVQGSVAVGLLLFGVAALVALGNGDTSYSTLSQRIVSASPTSAGVIAMLIVAALGFKAGAFPFHSWVPDAYETADPGAAAFLGSAPKVAAIGAAWVLFARTIWISEPVSDAHVAVGVMAAASVVFGNLAALKQRSVARMLGYSAIAQVGYALIGIAANAVGTGIMVASYALAVAVAFGIVAAVQGETGSPVTLESIAGLARRRPLASAALAISLLSLTGMPLTAGFIGKLWVFYGALGSGWTWLAVIGAIGSVVSFGYYGRVIRAAYFDDAPDELSIASAEQSEESDSRVSDAARSRTWPFVLAACVVLVVGTLPLITGFQWLLAMFAV